MKDTFKTDHISPLHNSFTEVLYPTPDSSQCALSQHNLLTASQFNNDGSVIVFSQIIPFRDEVQLSKSQTRWLRVKLERLHAALCIAGSELELNA